MNKSTKEFLAELKALLKKHSMDICAAASADDDSNLQSWIEIEKVTIASNGRRESKVVYSGNLDD